MRDLFLFASLGILKFIPVPGRNSRMHRMSRVFFMSHAVKREGKGEEVTNSVIPGVRITLIILMNSCSPLVPPLKPPFKSVLLKSRHSVFTTHFQQSISTINYLE